MPISDLRNNTEVLKEVDNKQHKTESKGFQWNSVESFLAQFKAQIALYRI